MLSLVLLLTICVTHTIYAASLPLDNTNTAAPPGCGEVGDCITNCTEPCACEKWYYYNNYTNECLLNVTYIKELMIEKYNTYEKLRQIDDRVFVGITVAGYIFVTCASLCGLSACVYCCRLNYSDYILQRDVTALAHKLQRDGKLNKKSLKQKRSPIGESCTVVVEDAGVFVC